MANRKTIKKRERDALKKQMENLQNGRKDDGSNRGEATGVPNLPGKDPWES